jgi:ATP-dependent Lon protease
VNTDIDADVPAADDAQDGTAPSPALADLHTALPLLPVSTGVVFPEMVVTIRTESDDARRAVDAARGADDHLVIVPRLGSRFASVGTVARIEQRAELPDGTVGIVVRGLHRARIGAAVLSDTPALWVAVDPVPDAVPDTATRTLAAEYREVAEQVLTTLGGRGMAGVLDEARSPGVLADTIGWWPGLELADRIELLETTDVLVRLQRAIEWARRALAEAQVTKKIAEDVNDSIEKTRREAILRRRLEAIRSELGEGGDDAIADYRMRLAALEVRDTVRAAIAKEIDRYERVGEQSMEASWIRTWLDTVFEIPWTTRTEDNLDLAQARRVLDEDHTGLDDVKQRIVEFLAVRKLRAERDVDAASHRRAGTILVLAGPPGVGKTSLGESVARALGRRFVRTSLGGIHDEAEIRGHRRTYVGARPGRIVRALIDAGSMNPVVLLDEIDKIGADWRGDPSAALLEVLDPAQNHTFRDHYLEIELDLSSVVFLATANQLDRMPAPLLDRMEVITISGYSDDEKLAIAREHLLPRVHERNGVQVDEVVLSDDLVRTIIDDYTREAGVRRLEQRLDRVIRRAATAIAAGRATAPHEVTEAEVRDALGTARHDDKPAERIDRPGVVAGLAVTGAGGDVLYVEAAATGGTPGLMLTGQLGDVMRESGEIALSYLRAHAAELGIPADALAQGFHVHFPSGAVPKDGPSAGITMTTALASALTGRPARADVAMTGEVTLQGRVLPIGGVKEKVLAAHRAGVRTVILPLANRVDADDIPAGVAAQLDIRFVDDVRDVLRLALTA